MPMHRTLVTTTDGSTESFGVLPHAAFLAQAAGLRLVVLHIVDDATERASAPRQVEALVAQRERSLRREIGSALQRLRIDADVRITRKPAGQRVHETILDEAVRHGAVALAMHSRGDNRMRTAVIGSTALRVLASAHMPVMVTTSQTTNAVPSASYSVLASTDGSARADVLGVALAALLRDAEITVLATRVASDGSVGPPLRLLAERLARWFPPHIPVHLATEHHRDAMMSVPQQLIATAEEHHVQAIAVSTRAFQFPRRFLGSVGLGLLAQSPVPLILAR